MTPMWFLAASAAGLATAAAAWADTPQTAAGVLAGGLWNLASLWCLVHLLAAWVSPERSRRRIAGWFLLKFPLLYLLVFALLHAPTRALAGFGIGFTVVLAVALGWMTVLAKRTVALPPHGR